MECRYCRALNAEDDHRCQRCGRRLRMTPVYTGQGAAAPELHGEMQVEVGIQEPRQEPRQEQMPAQESTKPRLRVVAYQPNLFGSRDMPLDVPRPQERPDAPEILEARLPNSRPRARKPVSTSQQSLEFSPLPLEGGAEPAIYCDAPVAITAHRLMGAACDGGIILLGMVLFLGAFYGCTAFLGGDGAQFSINKQTLPLLGGIAVLFTLLYNTLWALGNQDTAGMKWTRLRLVNFEGQKPDREQRLFRLASGCLSLMAAGLGLLWALVDEESLTWHDHMSKTFPTPY